MQNAVMSERGPWPDPSRGRTPRPVRWVGLGRIGLGRVGALALAALFLAVTTPGWAMGQASHVARANALYNDIPADKRSDPVLLPALAGLERPPIGVRDPADAQLAMPGTAVWREAESWAMAPAQRAGLEALRAAAEPGAFEVSLAFGLPYGTEGVSPELIRAGVHVELGDPPLLAAADYGYLRLFDRLLSLVHVEVTRLSVAGQANEAIDLLFRLAMLGRQMTAREMIVEVDWGYRVMIDSLSRMRDAAYIDYTGPRAADPRRLYETVQALTFDGPLALDRLTFPTADRIAAEQLIDLTYRDRGNLSPEAFVQTMARLDSGRRPLRRFAAAGRWSEAAGQQVDGPTIRRSLGEIHDAWTRFWQLPATAAALSQPLPLDEYENGRYAAVVSALRRFDLGGVAIEPESIFDDRGAINLARVATRQALALVCHTYAVGTPPTFLTVVRPRWISEIEFDPFDAPDRVGNVDTFVYRVPQADPRRVGEPGQPPPHEMEVFTRGGENFRVRLFNTDFLLYSAGANGADDGGTRVSEDAGSEFGDYLIWPPVLGLHRRFLEELRGG